MNRTIYSSVADPWRSHLAGDKATTPRLKFIALQSLMAASDPASGSGINPKIGKATAKPSLSRFESLMDKLKCQGPRDWLAWVSDVIELSQGCD